MHDVACEFARAIVRSKDAQKQLARTSLKDYQQTSLSFLKLYLPKIEYSNSTTLQY